MLRDARYEQFRQSYRRAAAAAESGCAHLLGYGLPILLLTCFLLGVILLF
jgi:hypothetical protein